MPWKLWTTHEDCLATHLFTKFWGVAICHLEIIVTLIFRRFGLKMLIRIIHAPKMFWGHLAPCGGRIEQVASWMDMNRLQLNAACRRIRVVRSTIVRPINYCGEV